MESKVKIKRRKTRVVNIGEVKVGFPYPISIQSMTTTPTGDVLATIKQIHKLQKSGCEIIRVSVLNPREAFNLRAIKKEISIPLVADIHFDWRLALLAIESGCDAIRINPGNIYKKEHLIQIVHQAKRARVPIRIGINSGSLRTRCGSKKRKEDLMVKSAKETIEIFEKEKFYDIIVSLKSSDVFQTIAAYKKMAELVPYPFHLGVTAAGLPEAGIIKSSVGIGFLLICGIGDTLRISLTGEPEREVEVARHLLSSLGLRSFGPEIISCPTCGRCKVDLPLVVKEVEDELKRLSRHISSVCRLKVAVMGCEVNGPGEAREADVGIACSRRSALLFAKAKKIKKVGLNKLKKELINFVKNEMVR
jgi:(E)-4-hydroxy-3-methylbut-2-enyl-diphosphate synthase